jgi:hypothetical protein
MHIPKPYTEGKRPAPHAVHVITGFKWDNDPERLIVDVVVYADDELDEAITTYRPPFTMEDVGGVENLTITKLYELLTDYLENN